MFVRHRVSVIKFGSFLSFTCFVLFYLGLWARLFEKRFDNFSYPFEGNISHQCHLIRHNLKPEVEPINNQTFTLRNDDKNKCSGEIFLLIIVKSKIDHFTRREAIRNSWGINGELNGVQTRTIFTLGIDKNTHDGRESSEQELVDFESKKFNDLVQVSF